MTEKIKKCRMRVDGKHKFVRFKKNPNVLVCFWCEKTKDELIK